MSVVFAFATSILEGESWVQGRLSMPERKVSSEKLFSKITLKDGVPKEKQTVLEYLNGE